MKIKIQTGPIFTIIMFVMALEMRFASIFEIPFLKVYANMTLIATIISMLLFFNSIVNNYIYNTLKPYRSFTNLFIVVLGLSIVLVTIYSYNRYGQTLLNYFSCFRIFLYFMLASSIIFTFTKQGGYEYFLKVLIVFTVIYIVLCYINSFSYSLRGELIWKTLQFGIRNDRLRCQIPYPFYILFPYVFYKIFQVELIKDKLKWGVLFVFFLTFINYIAMTRMLNSALYVFLLLSFVILPRNPNLRKTVLIIYGITLFVLIATGRIYFVINYIQSRDQNLGDSAEARISSINYFKSYAVKNPFFSMGYVSPTNEHFRAIFSGKSNSFFFDDIGIMNIYLHYGIVGSVPFVIFIVRILYLLVKIYFINKSPNKALFLGIIIFVGISQVSLCMFDGQRIMGAVMLWAIFEYEAYITSPTAKKERRKLSIRRNHANHTIQLRLDKQG
ncbi:MAG: hypothetical protein K6C14_04500 [Eubacterium sp.]|nr:hypothetical protein [Eubacterium sp.]